METLKNILSKITVWETWLNSYKIFVPKFIAEASTEQSWDKWDKDVFFEYFEKSNDQCVSSLQQGYFTNKEKDLIKDNWNSIAPYLARIANSQDVCLFEIYEALKKEIRKYTVQDRRASTYRLIAGLQPKLLCTIVKEADLKALYSQLLEDKHNELPNYKHNWFKDSFEICQLFRNTIPGVNPMDLITLPWQLKDYYENRTQDTSHQQTEKMLETKIVELLKYKKQIILQGPPGTGKTRLAKMIAKEIILGEITSFTISKEVIVKYMVPGLKFPSAKDRIEYEVEKVVSSGISIIASTKNSYVPLFNEIITAYNNKVWEKEGAITKGNDSYSAAIAKYISNEQLTDSKSIENSDRFKLIQFHPSYTYEDFVRGIVAKPNPDGEGILYESENKTLGIFAEEALQNYQLSKKNTNISVSDIELFDLFISNIKERIAESDEQRLQLTDAVYLFEPDDKRFKYKGDNWKAHSKGLNMKFSELQKIIIANVTERAEVKQLSGVEELTKQHASYFIRVVEMFYAFKKTHSLAQLKEERKASLKNYVLIIDEINRANLSSVLGELIYALEYRGEAVESMYPIDGNNQLTLPPNLYIIGTMNTADRSVGHIDYAIRRRFAFVDVLPKKLQDAEIVFHEVLFKQVAGLFIKNYDNYVLNNTIPLENERDYLSEEFDAKDVWLGHSYFIQKKVKDNTTLEPENFNIRIKYEIVPILREYVKDGILNEKATLIINEIEKSYPIN